MSNERINTRPSNILQRIEDTMIETDNMLAKYQGQVNKALDSEAKKTNNLFERQKNQMWWRYGLLLGVQVAGSAVSMEMIQGARIKFPNMSRTLKLHLIPTIDKDYGQHISKIGETVVTGIFDFRKISTDQESQETGRASTALTTEMQNIPTIRQAHQSALDRIYQQREMAKGG